MQRNLVIIALVVLVLAAAGYFLINRTTPSQPAVNQEAVPYEENDNVNNTVPNGTSTLSFNPVTVSGTTGNSMVRVTSENKKITGVQLEMKFDPQVVSDLTFSVPSSSVFGSASDYIVLFNKVDKEKGTATYAIAINLGKDPVNGTGDVINIAYTLTNATSTTIELTKKSIVTEFGNSSSVLRDVSSLSITH